MLKRIPRKYRLFFLLLLIYTTLGIYIYYFIYEASTDEDHTHKTMQVLGSCAFTFWALVYTNDFIKELRKGKTENQPGNSSK